MLQIFVSKPGHFENYPLASIFNKALGDAFHQQHHDLSASQVETALGWSVVQGFSLLMTYGSILRPVAAPDLTH